MISLITSLYRSSAHLPTFIERLKITAQQTTVPVELIIVANDATDDEQQFLHQLQQLPLDWQIHILHTERETLYASWNRGIAASQGAFITVWNVDDWRTADGLNQGYQLLNSGAAQIADFAFNLHSPKADIVVEPNYQPDDFSPKTMTSPFLIVTRDLINQAGNYHPDFKIAGDYEWIKRDAVRTAIYHKLDTIAGHFYLHGDNLSGNHSSLEWVECNTVLIWHQQYDKLRPVDPDLMRQVWTTWGHQGGTLPDYVAEWLWGDGAATRFESYSRERRQSAMMQRLRLSLAHRGLWTSTIHDVDSGASLQRLKDKMI